MDLLQSFNSIPRIKRLAAHAWRHYSEDRLFDEAASLSYTSLLATVPLLAVVFGIVSIFPVYQRWNEQIKSFIFSNFVPTSGDQLHHYLTVFLDSVGKLTLTGTLMLIVTALLLMIRIERAFNLIWRVPTARRIVNRIVVYWAVLTLGPLALGAAVALSAQPVFEQLAEGAASHSFWRSLGINSLSWFTFTLMFWLVPNRHVRLTHAMTGAFLSAVLFALAKKVFVAFVANASFNVIYGALASIPIFLFWLYVVWTVVLLGASLSASLTTFKDRKVEWGWPPKWRFLLTYRLVGCLWKAQLEGRTLANEDLLEQLEGVTEPVLSEQLELLFEVGYANRTEDGEWLLSRDLDNVSLLDLYHAGHSYLPIGEAPEIPSHCEWDPAFFDAVSGQTLDMQKSLKSMYTQSTT